MTIPCNSGVTSGGRGPEIFFFKMSPTFPIILGSTQFFFQIFQFFEGGERGRGVWM